MVYRGAMRIQCLAQGHTTEKFSVNSSNTADLLIVILEAYPLDHCVLKTDDERIMYI